MPDRIVGGLQQRRETGGERLGGAAAGRLRARHRGEGRGRASGYPVAGRARSADPVGVAAPGAERPGGRAGPLGEGGRQGRDPSAPRLGDGARGERTPGGVPVSARRGVGRAGVRGKRGSAARGRGAERAGAVRPGRADFLCRRGAGHGPRGPGGRASAGGSVAAGAAEDPRRCVSEPGRDRPRGPLVGPAGVSADGAGDVRGGMVGDGPSGRGRPEAGRENFERGGYGRDSREVRRRAVGARRLALDPAGEDRGQGRVEHAAGVPEGERVAGGRGAERGRGLLRGTRGRDGVARPEAAGAIRVQRGGGRGGFRAAPAGRVSAGAQHHGRADAGDAGAAGRRRPSRRNGGLGLCPCDGRQAVRVAGGCPDAQPAAPGAAGADRLSRGRNLVLRSRQAHRAGGHSADGAGGGLVRCGDD